MAASIVSSVSKPRVSTRQRSFTKRAEPFEALRARLGERDKTPDIEASIRFLDAVIDHLHTRASLPVRWLQRLPGALKELATLRYYRCSNGTKGFFRDLLERDAALD